jgi:hypothetical protein
MFIEGLCRRALTPSRCANRTIQVAKKHISGKATYRDLGTISQTDESTGALLDNPPFLSQHKRHATLRR